MIAGNKVAAAGKFHRRTPIGPRTLSQVEGTYLHLINGYTRHLPRAQYLVRRTLYRRRALISSREQRSPLRVRLYRRPGLPRKPRKNQGRSRYFTYLRARLTLAKRRLAVVKRQRTAATPSRHLSRTTIRAKTAVLRLKRYRRR